MKKFVLVIACLFSIGSEAFSQRRPIVKKKWELITITDNKLIYMNRRDARTIKKGVIRVWTKDVLVEAAPSVPTVVGEGYDPHSHTLILHDFDCENRLIRTINTILYKKSGDVLSSYKRTSLWSDIVPDSVGESMFNFICGR